MAVAKVIYKSSANATPEVWMDATIATATAEDVIAPKTAMLADGVVTTGTGITPTGITPTGTKSISITANGTTTEDVAAYANAEITVDVQGGGIYEQLITNTPAVVELVNSEITSLFGWCANSEVETIILPNLMSLDTGFTARAHGSLQTFVAPKLTSALTRLFYNFENLVDVWCPNIAGAASNGNTGMQRQFSGCKKIKHLYLSAWTYGGYCALETVNALESITFDDIVIVPKFYTAPALSTLIVRKVNANLGGSDYFSNTPIDSGTGYIYVPASSVSAYKTATNWSTYASQIIGIDEDTTGTVGTAFTPTATATGIVSWDKIDLQSYSVGTVDASTGAITPTHDGRCLIRGFDANDNIVHVTYLNVGAGFDWEAIA